MRRRSKGEDSALRSAHSTNHGPATLPLAFVKLAAVRTRFTDLIGCRLPFQLAVLGGVGTVELAKAVEQAGGLGMVPRRVMVPEPRAGALGKGFLIPYLPPTEEIAGDVRGLRV